MNTAPNIHTYSSASYTESYFRSIRGPVLLLVLGTLMLLDHIGSFGFGHTWPVLLVVLGLLVLAERLTQSPPPHQSPTTYTGGPQS